MIRLFMVLCLFLSCKLFSEETKDRLNKFQEGDIAVYEMDQSVSIISLKEKQKDCLVFQLVTASKDTFSRNGYSSWISWYKEGFPEALSSISSTIDYEGALLSHHEKAPWIFSLFQIQLKPIPENERRKIGPQPLPGEYDFRKPFQPPVIVNGKKIESESVALKATWPHDGSELDGKTFIVYFPKNKQAVTALPSWIETEGKLFHVALIDSLRRS